MCLSPRSLGVSTSHLDSPRSLVNKSIVLKQSNTATVHSFSPLGRSPEKPVIPWSYNFHSLKRSGKTYPESPLLGALSATPTLINRCNSPVFLFGKPTRAPCSPSQVPQGVDANSTLQKLVRELRLVLGQPILVLPNRPLAGV
jgi:hypothetical protein